MNPSDIDSTLRAIDELWPERFGAIHNEGMRNQLAAIDRCDGAQARLALQQVWAEKGRYAEPARMLEALRNVGKVRGTAPDPKQAWQAWRARQQEAESVAAQDDAATLRWVQGLDQDDIDALVAHVERTCGPMFKALVSVDRKIRRRHLETHPNVRGMLHAAERQLQRGAA